MLRCVGVKFSNGDFKIRMEERRVGTDGGDAREERTSKDIDELLW